MKESLQLCLYFFCLCVSDCVFPTKLKCQTTFFPLQTLTASINFDLCTTSCILSFRTDPGFARQNDDSVVSLVCLCMHVSKCVRDGQQKKCKTILQMIWNLIRSGGFEACDLRVTVISSVAVFVLRVCACMHACVCLYAYTCAGFQVEPS